MDITLYSNNCPRCKILKAKLEEKGIVFKENNDVEFMVQKGFTTAPILEVDDITYGYRDAVEWVKEYKA